MLECTKLSRAPDTITGCYSTASILETLLNLRNDYLLLQDSQPSAAVQSQAPRVIAANPFETLSSLSSDLFSIRSPSSHSRLPDHPDPSTDQLKALAYNPSSLPSPPPSRHHLNFRPFGNRLVLSKPGTSPLNASLLVSTTRIDSLRSELRNRPALSVCLNR